MKINKSDMKIIIQVRSEWWTMNGEVVRYGGAGVLTSIPWFLSKLGIITFYVGIFSKHRMEEGRMDEGEEHRRRIDKDFGWLWNIYACSTSMNGIEGRRWICQLGKNLNPQTIHERNVRITKGRWRNYSKYSFPGNTLVHTVAAGWRFMKFQQSDSKLVDAGW